MAEAKKKTSTKATTKKAEKPVQVEEVSSKSNSDKGIKAFIFGIGGAVIAVMLCCICCCGLFFALASSDNFKESYCEAYIEEQGSLRDEPFGWCDDYKPSFFRY